MANSNSIYILYGDFIKQRSEYMTMKPIRSNELDFWNNFVRDKFSDKKDDIRTELTQKAEEVSGKTHDAFIKKCGVENLLKEADKKYEKYLDFKRNKEQKEHQLHNDYASARDEVIDKLDRLSKVRNWDISFNSMGDTKTPDFIRKKLKEANYEEAYKEAKKRHSVYNQLKGIEESCRVAIHTGADIKDVVATLEKKMKRAEISLDVPQTLLGLPSK